MTKPRTSKPEALLKRLLKNPKAPATKGELAQVLALVIESNRAAADAARGARNTADAALYVANYCR